MKHRLRFLILLKNTETTVKKCRTLQEDFITEEFYNNYYGENYDA